MTVRGSFEATSGTTVTLKLTGGTGFGPEKALVAIHWSAADIQSATLLTGDTARDNQETSNMVWDPFEVDGTEYVKVEFSFKPSVTAAEIRAVVVDSDEYKLTADSTKIPQH